MTFFEFANNHPYIAVVFFLIIGSTIGAVASALRGPDHYYDVMVDDAEEDDDGYDA